MHKQSLPSRTDAVARLDAALDAHTGDVGSGRWVVLEAVDEGKQPAVGLAYVSESGRPDLNPWADLGGNAILKAAGAWNVADLGCGYQGVRWCAWVAVDVRE
jgi:hypothetical protein